MAVNSHRFSPVILMNRNKIGPTAYHQQGSGRTVVLVHGLGLNLDMWQWQREALSQNYQVLSYDLLGHGQSDKPHGEYTMDMMVEQLYQLVVELGHQQCALIGFSLGGLIVQAFALKHPDKAAALVVLNSAHDRTDEQRASIMLRVEQCRREGPAATVDDALSRWFSVDFAKAKPEVLQQVKEWVLANDADVYPEVYKLLALADLGLETSVSAIQCPSLIVTGEQDYGNSVEMAEAMAAVIPNSRLAILSALRHMALAEDPVQVNALLLDFLQKALTTSPE